MQLGMIGLGKMGAFMSERLMKAGHQVVGFDRDAAAVAKVKSAGAEGADSLASMVSKLSAPRAVWMMVPAGKPVDDTIADLVKILAPGDTIIDGGNSYYRDSQRRAAGLRDKKISYVDAGTSGGVWGLKEGYSLMVGGDEDVVARLAPIFQALAPAADKGWGRVGPCGAGHFVKMVHNGIEYAIMQGYAEGFDLMRHKTEMQLNLTQIAEIWRFGSVVRSWLLDLSADALTHNPQMEGIEAFVTDSGEGRWTAIEGIELGVPMPALSAALDARLRSQDPAPFADKLLAMMRHEFGGHAVKEDAPADAAKGKSK
jgi:6-phosphogluconate dehydrogenase